MHGIMLTSAQTKLCGISIISKLAVELPWVCSCSAMERCTAQLHPRAALGHRGSSEL